MNESALVTITQTIASPQMQSQLASLLPKEVPLDKFTEVCCMAIRQSPEVLEGDRQTLYDSCLQLARRGLLPDKKEAALVVFNTNVGTYDQPKWVKMVQAMPMVEGIIKEMGKAGVRAYAVSVYEKDTIELWNDDKGQHVKHKPVVFGDRGARVGCFAAAKCPDGRTYVEALSMADIEKVRSRSKQKDKKTGAPTGTWKSDPERMEQKSALHRLRKRIPILDNADALQNLKDMEAESDIELTNDGLPSSPPAKEETGSAERAESTAQASKSRRPKALQSVIDQVKPSASAEALDAAHASVDEYQGDDII